MPDGPGTGALVHHYHKHMPESGVWLFRSPGHPATQLYVSLASYATLANLSVAVAFPASDVSIPAVNFTKIRNSWTTSVTAASSAIMQVRRHLVSLKSLPIPKIVGTSKCHSCVVEGRECEPVTFRCYQMQVLYRDLTNCIRGLEVGGCMVSYLESPPRLLLIHL